MSHGEGPSDVCFFCSSRCERFFDAEEIPICAGCRGRPCFVAVAGPRPVQGPRAIHDRPALRPANPQLLADALISLREFVLSDREDPEIPQRPRYLTSSNTNTEKK